jgi:hypothetical protein
MKISNSIVTVAIVGLVLLGALIFVVHEHTLGDRLIMAHAVTRQLDAHTTNIAVLLGTMSTNDTPVIEDAVYAELQRADSTSLITRSDIQVVRTDGGFLQCFIDTRRFGVPPRSIRRLRPTNSLMPDKH